MLNVLKQKIEHLKSNEEKINASREYLQLLVLKILFDKQYFTNLAFVGGTALRVIYDLKRFSEDLDFSLINKTTYSFEKLLKDLNYEIKHYGLEIEITNQSANTVNMCMLKFPGLLYDLHLATMKNQKLSVKLEIDTNPPSGWATVLSPVTKSFMFAVTHFDLPSSFSTKLHACLFRKYTKGRDYYDLFWYIGQKVNPNYLLLNNAIKQTEKMDIKLNSRNIKEFLLQQITKVDFTLIRKDVERFLENKSELKLLDNKIFEKIVNNYVFLPNNKLSG